MNAENFSRWVQEKLLPNLPKPSVIVMDNASYHTIQTNRAPKDWFTKTKIRDWLPSLHLPWEESFTKPELLCLVKRNKPEPIYYIDELLRANGHEVLSLPPYHCHLSPIELIWSLVKRKVGSVNVTSSARDMAQKIEQAFASLTSDDWLKCAEHVKKLEEEHRQQDRLLDDLGAFCDKCSKCISSILMCSSALKCTNETTPLVLKDNEDETENENENKNIQLVEDGDNISRLLDHTQLAEYTQQIVGYIAGCVVRCLSKQIKCTPCIECLLATKKLEYHKLVSTREGGLIYASQDVYSVCKATEAVIRNLKQNLIMTSANYTKIVSTVMKQFIGSNNSYVKVESAHECGPLHQVNLMRLVAERYLSIRCYQISKLDNVNSDATSKRKLFKKQIQREGH